MKHSLLSSPSRREVSFFVCESGRRWCDAARRFVGPFQHEPDSASVGLRSIHNDDQTDRTLFLVRPVEHAKARASLAGTEDAAVLWEVTTENATSVALTIAQIGVGRPDVIQIVALSDGTIDQSTELGIQILELGVSAVIRSPAELATMSRLVRRRFDC